jgi:hypothetical protein
LQTHFPPPSFPRTSGNSRHSLLITAHFLWPSMAKDINNWTKQWISCHRAITTHTSPSLGEAFSAHVRIVNGQAKQATVIRRHPRPSLIGLTFFAYKSN